jgi:hypothetical protein
MDHDTPSAALARFDAAIASAGNADAVWRALRSLSAAVAGHRLFTVMTVDMKAGLARRAFSDNVDAYPVSGTKPIQPNAWFDIVHGEKRSFVANTIGEIAAVFPDHALIAALGCGSVVNLPVVLNGDLAATINLLDVEQHYTPARVQAVERHLSIPAKLAVLAARQFDSKTKNAD